MNEFFFLYWAALAVSLANVIMLGWLALTVLLNAERRHLLVWGAGGGLFVGCAFFVSHTAILVLSLESFGVWLNRWWRLGWLPLTAAPLAWYGMVLWYVDFWSANSAQKATVSVRRPRHQVGLVMTVLLFLILMGLMLFLSSLPSFVQTAQLQFSTTLTLGGFPVLLLIFPVYIVVCIVLSLDALYHPVPSERFMGDQARRRARPWLMAATALLLLVSLVVGGVIGWLLFLAQPRDIAAYGLALSIPMAGFDLLISALIALAVMMIGQAIISYEIFTGKTLPRGELRRSWYNAIVLALGFGLVVGLSFALQMQPISALLLATLLMTAFYALLNWRSYARREEYIRQLRPFVGSQHLYERMLMPPSSTRREQADAQPVDVDLLFQTLCTEVLAVLQAQLVPLGALASLVDSPLHYLDPRAGRVHADHLALPSAADATEPSSLEPELRVMLTAPALKPEIVCIPLEQERFRGFAWAVPLWSNRGLIGVFLLGPKRDGGLFTQEEMEIARASGERLLDTQASTEITRRLMMIQRQQLTESQLLDRRARRMLHDDVLPQLHAALLALGTLANDQRGQDVIAPLTDAHRQISNLLRDMPTRPVPELSQVGLLGALQQLVADELRAMFDEVTWQIDPQAWEGAKHLPPLTAEVLFYAAREAMRNAARHGRGSDPDRPLCLHVEIIGTHGLQIHVEDDGVGLGNTVSSAGAGHGLMLHRTLLAIVGGTLEIKSQTGAFTRVTVCQYAQDSS
ncbi:MAG TPA: hypothetical protein ENK30_02635 [Anaerolineae bacterium]|nr:hypothetical protein [Anaerolineae bacterium]